MRWRDIEVRTNELGKPSLHLYGFLQEQFQHHGLHDIHLSLSHSSAYAIAQVIIES
jgi:holo-[acyl-carrier protein] synthase